jgi:hypothetical protein
MFKTESEMNEKSGVALWKPWQAVSYQIAGAFNRLGIRMTALVDTETRQSLFKSLPMTLLTINHLHENAKEFSPDKTSPVETFIFTLDPWLTKPLGNAEINLLIENLLLAKRVFECLKKNFSNLRGLWILPDALLQNENRDPFNAWLETLAHEEELHSFLFCPLSFSFRDDFLFDRSFALLNQNPSLLEKISPIDFQVPFCFAADIAALGLTITQNQKYWGRKFFVPAVSNDLSEWQTAFRNEFFESKTQDQPKISLWLQKWAHRLDSTTWIDSIVTEHEKAELQKLKPLIHESAFQKIENAYQVFPTSQTNLSRAFKSLKRSIDKFPETELIFTPGVNP